MNANFLNKLDRLVAKDKVFFQQTQSTSMLESALATWLLEDGKAEIELALTPRLLDIQETLAAIEGELYPFRPGWQKRLMIRVSQLQKKLSIAAVQQLKDTYGLDQSFSDFIQSVSDEINSALILQKPLPSISFPEAWQLPKIALCKRAILLKLSKGWEKESIDEPIFWKASGLLKKITGGSFFGVEQAFYELLLLITETKQAAIQGNPLSDFFISANDDKSGNILDNLILSQATYQALLDDGWQPDRWELENMPMSIGMFIDFMRKSGFNQRNDIGDVIEIGLKEATENYRYRGSPFISSDELKRVKVIVPGWEQSGELIVRPKVNEITG